MKDKIKPVIGLITHSSFVTEKEFHECLPNDVFDADKEGFLRSESALIQTIGRAARHVEGKVIMFADHITESMEKAISETNRRREIQQDRKSVV